MPGKRPPRKKRRFISLKTLAARAQVRSSSVHYIISSSATHAHKVLTFLAASARQSAGNTILSRSAGGSYYNVKTDGNAHGDGLQDDTQHILAAITAYKALGKIGLYFPAGTYLLSTTLTVPSGTVLFGPPVSAIAYPTAGCNTPTAWLKGKVIFGSNSTFSDLKIGDSGTSTQNGSGATNTSFTRCQFRGGGGGTGANAPTTILGWASSCSHLTFNDCNWERSIGTWGNNFTINAASNATVDYITWNRCHFGISNGVASGAVIANMEATTLDNVQQTCNGWSHFTFDYCVLEATGWFNLDFTCSRIAGTSTLSAHDVIITNCLFKGAGLSNSSIGYDLCLESPYNVLVSGNTFWRSTRQTLKFAYQDQNAVMYYDITNQLIENNVFQLDYNNGITPSSDLFYFAGNDIDFRNNTIVTNQGNLIWDIWDCHNSTLTGNTLEDTRSSGAPMYYQFVDTTNTVMTGNTFYSHTGGAVTYNIGSGNSGNTYSPNTTVQV